MRTAAVLLAVGLAVTGLTACDDAASKKHSDDPPMDEGIEDFDFANATVVDSEGRDHEFSDGSAVKAGYEGTDVGWHIASGPVFTDIDDDNDLDAALLYKWVPAAGASAVSAYIWTWDDKKAEQVRYQIRGGNGGGLSDLVAKDGGFQITAVSRPVDAPASEPGGEEETFTVGLKDDYPVQIEPTFGSVDRCVIHPDDPPGARGDGTAPRIVPEDHAPAIGEAAEFTTIKTVASIWNDDAWTLVRAEREDGSVSCGWLATDDVGQG